MDASANAVLSRTPQSSRSVRVETVMTFDSPSRSVPNEQLKVWPASDARLLRQLSSWSGSASSIVQLVPSGSASLTTTSNAAPGPAFHTVIV